MTFPSRPTPSTNCHPLGPAPYRSSEACTSSYTSVVARFFCVFPALFTAGLVGVLALSRAEAKGPDPRRSQNLTPVEALLKRGRQNAALGNFRVAERLFAKALFLPKCPLIARWWRMEILIRLRRYQEALDELRRGKKTFSKAPSVVSSSSPWRDTRRVRKTQSKLQRLVVMEKTTKEHPAANSKVSTGHPMSGANARSSGWVSSRGPTARTTTPKKVKITWRQRLSGAVSAEPVMDSKGNIFVGTRRGLFYRLEAKGSVAWRARLDSPVLYAAALQSPSSPKGAVYVTTSKATLWALSRLSGKTLWKKPLSSRASGPPRVDAKGQVALLAGGALLVFDSKGSLLGRWAPKSVICRGGPISLAGRWYIACDDGGVWSKEVTAKGFVTRWKSRCGRRPITQPPTGSRAGLLLVLSGGGEVCAFAPRLLTLKLWSLKTTHRFHTPPLLGRGGHLFVGTEKGSLAHFSVYGREFPVLSISPGEGLPARPLMDREGNLYIGTRTGYLVLLTKARRVFKKLSFGVDIDSSPALSARGTLILGTDAGEIIAIKAHAP